jgi:hypothetical protein
MLPFSSARRRDGVGHQKSRLNRSRAPGEEKALKTVYTESNLLYDKKQAHQKWAVFMADRKQFQNVPAADPDLMRLLGESRNRAITEEELQEQRVSFAFGNAPVSASDRITKASIRAASTHIRLF